MAYFYNDRQVRQAIRSRSGCFTIHQEAGRADCSSSSQESHPLHLPMLIRCKMRCCTFEICGANLEIRATRELQGPVWLQFSCFWNFQAHLPLELQNRLGNWLSRRYDIYSLWRLSFVCFGMLSNKTARRLSIRARWSPRRTIGTSFVVVEKSGSDVILELTSPVGGPFDKRLSDYSACCNEWSPAWRGEK